MKAPYWKVLNDFFSLNYPYFTKRAKNTSISFSELLNKSNKLLYDSSYTAVIFIIIFLNKFNLKLFDLINLITTHEGTNKNTSTIFLYKTKNKLQDSPTLPYSLATLCQCKYS